MILTTTLRMLLMLAALATLVMLPVHLLVEAQRRDNRELRIHEVKQLPSKAKRFALVIGVDELWRLRGLRSTLPFCSLAGGSLQFETGRV